MLCCKDEQVGDSSCKRQWRANAGSVSCVVGVSRAVTQQESGLSLERLTLGSVGKQAETGEKAGAEMRSP